jgi:hypothetical protein
MEGYEGADIYLSTYLTDPTTRKWQEVVAGDIQILPSASGVEELLLYDLAAVSGLDYVETASKPEVMAVTNTGPEYGPGDLAGLKLVGARKCT